jgi:hypothetical protein
VKNVLTFATFVKSAYLITIANTMGQWAIKIGTIYCKEYRSDLLLNLIFQIMKKLKLDLSPTQLGEVFDSLKLSNAELANFVGGCFCVDHGTTCGSYKTKD